MSSTGMRAAQVVRLGTPEEALEIVDVDPPDPGPNEVRLRVEACALNRLDVFARLGHPEADHAFPRQTGGDIAGVVEDLGPDVDEWSVGDRVVVYPIVSCGTCEYCDAGEQTMCPDYEIIGEDRPGGLAEAVVVPAETLSALPLAMDFVTAAAWPVAYTTAWRMLVGTGDLRADETALILGASGGVGYAALDIANHLGATAYATTSSDRKAELLADRAVEVIDYAARPFDDAVMDLTDGRGVDLVADHVGQETWQRSVNSLAKGGRMVVCGATSGADGAIDIRSLYQHHRQILGAPMGSRREFETVGERIADGSLSPRVDRVLPLADVAEGHRALEERDVVGKVVVRPLA